MSEFQSDIDSYINIVNSNIDYLSKFNSFVTKCVKSYLCKYITLISSHYNSCYNSLIQNIETFECIQKCVKFMESQITGRSRSEKNLKRVFSYISDDNVRSTIRNIKRNSPIGRINSINIYLTSIVKFLDESNPIDKTTRELGSLKHDLSQFSAYIGNYNTRIRSYLIHRLDILTDIEQTITRINNNGGIKGKYQAIKHKVEYCKASLEFEVKRLESISKNAKMLQEHLGKISGILNKHQSNMKRLEEFRDTLNKMKLYKDKKIKYLTSVARSIIFNLDKVKCISNSLKCRIECVGITTIKGDIENINSAIKDINNILSVVKSHLKCLFGVNLGVDCKIVNEVESCILGIVSEIHKKYCCLSSDISKIFSDQPNLSTLGESCKLCEIVECTSTAATCSSGQTSSQSCERCQDFKAAPGSPGCEICLKNCQGLQQLLDKSNESNIKQKLKCVEKVISQLKDGQSIHSTTCSQNQQCSTACLLTGQPYGTTTECKGTTKVGDLIKCCLDEISKCQTSYTSTCQGKEDVKCEQTSGKGTTTGCSQSNSSTISNCNQLDKVKLWIDTMINKCNCCNLKKMLEDKNIQSCVDVFKWVMITNFKELFCIYSSFDKSILDQISCSINKLDEMKFDLREMLCIQGDIKSWIDCIKNEINGLSTKVESLENTMKSGIREMECAIEGVARNLIECSLQSLRIHVITGSNCINHNNINNDGEVNDHNKDNNDKRVFN